MKVGDGHLQARCPLPPFCILSYFAAFARSLCACVCVCALSTLVVGHLLVSDSVYRVLSTPPSPSSTAMAANVMDNVPRHLQRNYKRQARKGEPLNVTIKRKVHQLQSELISRKDKASKAAINSLLHRTVELLTPTLWDEVVEERAAEEICGNPFCAMTIPPLPPVRRKFAISLKGKGRMVDVQGRDQFCSQKCWNRSRTLKSSLSKETPQLRALKSRPAGNDMSAVPVSAMKTLEIIERAHDASTIPTPPILLTSDAYAIDGYRPGTLMQRADKEHIPKKDTSQPVEEPVVIGISVPELIRHWYSDVTTAFLRNAVRIPLEGHFAEKTLFWQRVEMLSSMLCPYAFDAAIAVGGGCTTVDRATLEDDMRVLIGTFTLAAPVPPLSLKQRREAALIMMTDLAEAGWQIEREARFNQLAGDGLEVGADCPHSSDDGEILFPSIVKGASAENVCQTSKRLPLPGRAGAVALGRKRQAKRAMDSSDEELMLGD